jgi:DNA repair exonuclease SbcCD ATPase subunit
MHALGMGPLTLEAGEDQRLALSVPGRGGGTYQGLSGGERRRTDLALQLGLSQMVGGGSGTLWLDEAFDALDRDGAERAAVVARELAATRCVVVISHSEALQEALRPDMVLACPL